MALSLTIEADNLAVIHGTGELTRPEADAIKQQVIAFIQRVGRIRLLIVIEPGFRGIDHFASWEDDHDDEFIQQHLIKMAIVGELKWQESALLFFLHGLLPFSIQYFSAEQENLARAWLSSE
ncbi:STAS/SEC14 domain-containing protein [Methylocucumis oryzae]|uniref:STAS/SEC14 domain-containing protein n=1 Tax=Methylocucumis oryzae TaxID=1632867 RepID=A0A0F3IL36_9GAMM|nr:STAS/SEC14 domain-containing protein [Methylocucumis oryzae]KJV07238.1 hypothetical protein VZ94_06060 [Methylocucumis oryzae]